MRKLIFFTFIIIFSGYNAQVKIDYNSPGTFLWEPNNYVDSVTIEVWGAGGGGGGCASVDVGSPSKWGGGGGGSGAYVRKKISLQSFSDISLSFTIGQGSTGAGGQSKVFSGTTNYVFASGGAKGGNAGFELRGPPGLGATNKGCLGGCDFMSNGFDGIIGGQSTHPIAATGGNGGASYLGASGGLGGNKPGNTLSFGAGQSGNNSGAGGGGKGTLTYSCASNANSSAGIGANGRISVSYHGFNIAGRVFNDYNASCSLEALEPGMGGVNFYIPEIQFIGQTDNMGYFLVPELQPGNYSVQIETPNGWNASCPTLINFSVSNSDSVFYLPFVGLFNDNPCTDPDITIYAPFLRRCFSNQNIYVSACNQNTATGILDSSYVEVELDNLLTLSSATLPYTSLGNNVFRFETGDLNPGQCVNFKISTSVSCNALNGQTLCMDATLYPIESCALDTIPTDPPTGGGGTGGTIGTLNGLPQPCLLPWDQSSLSVDGWCANDSIYFTITNTGEFGGGDMECYSPMWITVDGVVTYTDSIMIQGGQTLTLSFPGDGQTWIVNAEQHPLHPGNSHPNAHVEACGDTTNWTPDIVNDFPQDDADPVVDIYCGVVTGSFDPNDKTGYPIGQTEQFYIQPNQQMQYVIRFQNTGTDTAFTVVIRDTLETDLNIFSLTPGVSSHNYEFRMYGPRVLEWTFNNILLPDSTTNSEASNGFVTFHVEQVPGLAPGTEITNDADIYFDFNDPITTNTTMHRIYEGFVSVAELEEMSKGDVGLMVYPNPNNGQFEIVQESSNSSSYTIFDQQGRVVKTGFLEGQKTLINPDLHNGMYYLMVEEVVVKVQVLR